MNILDDIKALLVFKKAVSDAVLETKMNNVPTPGWKTSEFWMHLLAQLPALAAMFFGANSSATIGIAVGANLGAAIYTACRSNVKMAALDALKNATDALNAASASASAPVPSAPAQ